MGLDDDGTLTTIKRRVVKRKRPVVIRPRTHNVQTSSLTPTLNKRRKLPTSLAQPIDYLQLEQEIRTLVSQLDSSEVELEHSDERESGEWDATPVSKHELEQLSDAQRKAFEHATRSTRNLFVTGGAGTGKTHLLRLIVRQWRHDDPGTSVVLAPTGMASQNVSGAQTIHSFLETSDPAKVKLAVACAFLEKKPHFAAKIKLLKRMYIDEISMVTIHLFERLDGVLRHFLNAHLPFGGLQVVITGDFHQLPPFYPADKRTSVIAVHTKRTEAHRQQVKQNNKSTNDACNSTQALYCFESPLWFRLFHDRDNIQLTVCYRSQEDARFTDMCNEIRRGKASEETIRLLQAQSVASIDSEEGEFANDDAPHAHEPVPVSSGSRYSPTAHQLNFMPCIFCRNTQVDRCNAQQLGRLLETHEPTIYSTDVTPLDWTDQYLKIYELRKKQYEYHFKRWQRASESDQVDTDTNQRMISEYHMRRFLSKYHHMTKSASDAQQKTLDKANSLPPSELKLVPGMPVMLIKNINVARGLFNGRRGFVLRIDKETGYPWIGWIGLERPHLLKPETWSFPYQHGQLRLVQLPLQYAWAFTVHKVQGLGLARGFVDLTDAFAPGQAYTAISRFSKLSGIRLLGLAIDKIITDFRVRRFHENLDRLAPAQRQSSSSSGSLEKLTVAKKPTVKERINEMLKSKTLTNKEEQENKEVKEKKADPPLKHRVWSKEADQTLKDKEKRQTTVMHVTKPPVPKLARLVKLPTSSVTRQILEVKLSLDQEQRHATPARCLTTVWDQEFLL